MYNYRNLRNLIFERDSYTCVLCEAAPSDLHHVLPRSRGGADSPFNLVSVCRFHHELLHGSKIRGIELSTEEAKQAVIEYLDDLYASQREAARWRREEVY